MYRRILLPVDLDEEGSARRLLATALELCRGADATLHVMTVVPGFGLSMVSQYFPKGYEKDVREKTLARLHRFVRDNAPEGTPVQHIVGEGTIYEVVLRTAEHVKADLIVIASHGPRLKDYLLGPNAARVVRHATCSVLVVR